MGPVAALSMGVEGSLGGEEDKGPFGLPSQAYAPPVNFAYRCGSATGSGTGPAPVHAGSCLFVPIGSESGPYTQTIRWLVVPLDRIDQVVGVKVADKEISVGTRVGAELGVPFEIVLHIHWDRAGTLLGVDLREERIDGIDLEVGGLGRARNVLGMVGGLLDPPTIVPPVGPQVHVRSLVFGRGAGILVSGDELVAELTLESATSATIHADLDLGERIGGRAEINLVLPDDSRALIIDSAWGSGVFTDLPRHVDLTMADSFGWLEHTGTSLDGTLELGASTISFQDLPQDVWIDWDMKGVFGDCGSDDLKPVIDIRNSPAPWGTDLDVEIVQDTMIASASVENLERLDLDLDLAEKAYRVEMEFVQQTGEVSFQIDGVEHDSGCGEDPIDAEVIGRGLGELHFGVADRDPGVALWANLAPEGRATAKAAKHYWGIDFSPEIGLHLESSICSPFDEYTVVLAARAEECLSEGECGTYELGLEGSLSEVVGLCALRSV